MSQLWFNDFYFKRYLYINTRRLIRETVTAKNKNNRYISRENNYTIQYPTTPHINKKEVEEE